MFLYTQIDLLRIVPPTGVSRPTGWGWEQPGLLHPWCFPLPRGGYCWGNTIPPWNIPSWKRFLLGAPPRVPPTRLSHPKVLLPSGHIPVFSQRASLKFHLTFSNLLVSISSILPPASHWTPCREFRAELCFLQNRAETVYGESVTQARFVSIPEHSQIIS